MSTTTADIVREAWGDIARMIPCLWGPPRRGKTWTLLEIARAYTGSADRIKVMNPALDLPEDTGGVLRVDPKTQRAFYTKPPLIPQEWLDNDGPCVVIVDEIDKATDETLCTLLTMLSHERRIRDTRLPAGLRFACAGNEPKAPLPEPLIGRMLHLRFPVQADAAVRLRDYDALSAKGSGWIAEVARNVLAVPQIAIPVRVSGDDSITALASWLTWADAMAPDTLSRLVEGLFRREDVPSILDSIERDELDADHLGAWLDNAPIAVIVSRLHRHVAEAGPGMAGAAIHGLRERAERDASGEVQGVLDALLGSDEALAFLGPGTTAVATRGKQAWARALKG